MFFTFFVFDQKYLFWANLAQKIKIMTLIWNLVASLIRICRKQKFCSLFFCFRSEYSFLANLFKVIKIVSLRLNLVASLIRIYTIQRCCSVFSFSTRNSVFRKIWSKKIVILSWNLVPKLTKMCAWVKCGGCFKLGFFTWNGWNRGAGHGLRHGWVSMVWWFGLPFIGLQSLAGYLGLTLVFVWDSALWGGGG